MNDEQGGVIDMNETETMLKKISGWDIRDVRGLFQFIEEQMKANGYGSFTRTVMPDGRERIRIATGGWSDNEDMLIALRYNFAIHGSYWQSSSRGGLEIYIIPGSAKENC
jgi:hypothetical protein